RKALFGYAVVVASGIAICFLSLTVWAHHMFTVGMGQAADAAFGLSSMTIAVPTGIKVFSWLATIWGGRIRLTTAMLYAVAFIAQFTIGGLSGVHFATVPVDWHTHDSYYVVAHFHYVIGGGSLFAILAATYYWFPKITGRMLDEGLGKLGFWIITIGFTLTFFPMHFLGLMGQPRRTYTYPDLPGWGALNLIETIGAFLMTLAVALIVLNMLRSLRSTVRAPDNPWQAWTLEWATTSPPPPENFVALPTISSNRPLYDLEHASSARPAPSRAVAWRSPMVGIGAFIFSEATFFAMLIAAFLEYRTRSVSGPTAHDLNVARTVVFSLFLFASSGTIYFAERQLHRDNQRGFVIWWAVTIIFGAIFLGNQLLEYARLYQEGIRISTNLFTTAFYTLTGFHGLHVLVGLIALLTIGGLARQGDFRAGRRRVAVDTVAVYWHFVDAVWVVVLTVVYLQGLVS
ncbi:MAG TPA: cbb3-type cytochrome c oxidase subunit I, partial [Chloroflexota bacterium]|nr:cbb3-type cytochrome c oxidase subunit I [Chloroflexota bacterium]